MKLMVGSPRVSDDPNKTRRHTSLEAMVSRLTLIEPGLENLQQRNNEKKALN